MEMGFMILPASCQKITECIETTNIPPPRALIIAVSFQRTQQSTVRIKKILQSLQKISRNPKHPK